MTVPATILMPARYALRHAAQVIVPTDEDRDYLLDTLGLPPDRVSRVDNGAPPPLSRQHSPLASRTGSLGVLFFASWIDRKGISELVAATCSLASRGIPFRLTAAGGNVPASYTVAAFPPAARHLVNVRPRISREELPALLADHDVLVAPSWFEGMPLTVLEAASAGLALVLSDIAGHRQILMAANRDGPSALLFPPHESDALAEAISRLVDDAKLLEQLQRNSLALAARLSWEHAGQQLESAYFKASTHAVR